MSVRFLSSFCLSSVGSSAPVPGVVAAAASFAGASFLCVRPSGRSFSGWVCAVLFGSRAAASGFARVAAARFRLDFSCQECNVNRLNQVIDRIRSAWNCTRYGSSKDEDRFFEMNGYDCDTVAVDTIIYWNGHNTAEIQQYIDSNCEEGKELIAIIDHPEFEDEGYEYIDSYPLVAPPGYRWKYIDTGCFRVLERHSVTYWTTSFVVVEDDNELQYRK